MQKQKFFGSFCTLALIYCYCGYCHWRHRSNCQTNAKMTKKKGIEREKAKKKCAHASNLSPLKCQQISTMQTFLLSFTIYLFLDCVLRTVTRLKRTTELNPRIKAEKALHVAIFIIVDYVGIYLVFSSFSLTSSLKRASIRKWYWRHIQDKNNNEKRINVWMRTACHFDAKNVIMAFSFVNWIYYCSSEKMKMESRVEMIMMMELIIFFGKK